MNAVIVADADVVEILQLHGEVLDAACMALEKAIRIGGLLESRKSKLKHGEWLPWLKKNLPFSDRTARNYIRIHEERDTLKLESVSNLTDAYKLLKESKTLSPPPSLSHRSHKEWLDDGAGESALLCMAWIGRLREGIDKISDNDLQRIIQRVEEWQQLVQQRIAELRKERN